VEIILGQKRRRWSEDEKRALVAETFVNGQTVNGVARRHNISRSMLLGWRKQYCETLGVHVDIPTVTFCRWPLPRCRLRVSSSTA
jgi:transposase-like protein